MSTRHTELEFTFRGDKYAAYFERLGRTARRLVSVRRQTAEGGLEPTAWGEIDAAGKIWLRSEYLEQRELQRLARVAERAASRPKGCRKRRRPLGVRGLRYRGAL